MLKSVRPLPLLFLLILGLLITGSLVELGATPARGADQVPFGIQNPGFESNTTPDPDYVSDSWQLVSEPVTDNVVVRASDSGGEYPTLGDITILPRTGSWMLRFGTPKDTNSHQPKGVTTVKQTFRYDGADIGLSCRVLTWEHNDTDAFIVDIRKGDGSDPNAPSVGKIASTEESLPYRIALKVEPRKLKWTDFGWQDARITGLDETLELGDLVTIYLTLDTNTNAAHDSWVYVDLADLPPVSFTPQERWFVAPTTIRMSADGLPITYSIDDGATTPYTDAGVSITESCTLYYQVTYPIYGIVERSRDYIVGEIDFSVMPDGSDEMNTPHEGDVIGLYATPLNDPALDEQTKTWTWTIPAQAPYLEGNTYDGPVGYLVPADAGYYPVTLRVTDTATGAWIEKTKTIHVVPQPPRVQAIDVEGLPGSSVQLVGRFVDPGWTDEHTAQFVIPGLGTFDADVSEDHAAAMESGYVSATVTLPDEGFTGAMGTLIVTDKTDSTADSPVTASDTFQISVVTPAMTRYEPNDGFSGENVITSLSSGATHLSYIQSIGDVDIYEVTLPGGAALPYGTEVLATLTGLPADYDLAILEDFGADAASSTDVQVMPFLDSGFASSPYIHSPYIHSPYIHSPLEDAPYIHSPYIHSPLEDSPYIHSPYIHSPYIHSPYIHSPYVDMPYIHSPYIHSPVDDTPYIHSPFLDTPYIHSPYIHSPYIHSPYIHSPMGTSNSLDGFPLSEMSYTGVRSDKPSGNDIKFEGLGFNNEDMAGKRTVDFSANTGTGDEVALARVDSVGVRIYVAVVGHYGAHSTIPYTLQLETSLPMDVLALANEDVEHDALVSVPNPVEIPTTIPNDAVETLFVTQPERMRSLYDAAYGEAAWDELASTLAEACNDPRVKGKVISLPALIGNNAYGAWDERPFNTELANAVSRSIRDVIQNAIAYTYPNVKYVVIVGSDKVVPFYRAPDQTIVGNERVYGEASFLRFDSTILASEYNSMVLTDDYYVEADPIEFNGHFLYLPDVAVSRLVETPVDIVAALRTFLDGSGELSRATALVTGHDFMTDGANQVAQILSEANIPLQTLISEYWNGSTLKTDMLTYGTAISSINAHFTHFAALSAFGFIQAKADEPWSLDELLTGSDIAAATNFQDKLAFSMGCHAGLNTPDEQTVSVDAEAGIEPALDLPQAMMRQGGVWVGSTGYGYGDTVGIAGTEALIALFAKHLTQDAGSVGEALKAAKQEYMGSVTSPTGYDEKSCVEFTMYGMPQYSLAAAVTQAANASELSVAADGGPIRAQSDTTLGTFTVHVVDGTTSTPYSATLVQHDETEGSYITADGDHQATADRPIQPRLVIPVDNTGKDPVRSVIVGPGDYTEITPFDPAISRWTCEWEANPVEFQVSTSGWWPSDAAALSSIETDGELQQRLIVIPGQFLADGTATGDVTGTERVWSDLTIELVRSPAPTLGSDVVPPTLTNFSAIINGEVARVFFSATDSSPIVRAIVNEERATESLRHEFDLTAVTPGPGGAYTLEFAPPPDSYTGEVKYMVRVYDSAGNSTLGDAKAARVEPVVPDSEAFFWDEGSRIDLGTLGGMNAESMAINDLGQVVGWAQTTEVWSPYTFLPTACHAFLWQGGEMIDLGTLGGPNSCAIDINDSGQVVGVADASDGSPHLFLWESSTGMQDLYGPIIAPAVFYSYPRLQHMCEITDNGWIYSWMGFSNPIQSWDSWTIGVRSPYTGLWSVLGSAWRGDYVYFSQLGLSQSIFGNAYGNENGLYPFHGGSLLNSDGQVCLSYPVPRIVYPDTSSSELGALGGTSTNAMAMGANETAIGMSQLPFPDSTWHACLWRPGATPFTPVDPSPGPDASCALFLANEDGTDRVTGIYAGMDSMPKTFFFDGTASTDIGSLGGNATIPAGFNNSGHIVGASYYDNPSYTFRHHAFFWEPGGSTSGTMTDLTPFSGRSAATDVNEGGQVVGYLYPRADQ